MIIKELEFEWNLGRVEVEDSDVKSARVSQLRGMVFGLFLIREFEQTLLRLCADGCVHGPVHTSIGHEACAVGVMAALRAGDKMASTHRAHHHYLAKLMSYYGFVGDGELDAEIQDQITRLMGEIMGLSIGCCGGRGGSMHLRNETIGVIGTNAIVAGGVPLATGAAFTCKYLKSDDVVICFMGDGAINQGAFHEAANLAGIWNLPVVYFIENNLYAVGTSIRDSSAVKDLAVRASAYGLRGMVVDGMDPVAVMKATQTALEAARHGGPGTIIEAKCYRFPHHAGSVAGSSFGYRQKEEEAKWNAKDPLVNFPKKLVSMSLLSQSQVDTLERKAEDTVKWALKECTDIENDKIHVKNELWPQAGTVETGVRSEGKEFDKVAFKEKSDFAKFDSLSYSDAIAAVTRRWLEKDSRVFVVGEEIANFGGGPYGATKGLPAQYPKRILNTPISECGFVGLAGGAAMSGLRPVVEIMFPDFSLVAADQLFNQIGKLRHMYGNTTEMPVVVRTRIAIGCGYGGQHSMDPVGLFSLFSGWRVVAPSNAFDYVGLFNSAMVSTDPVLIVEHHALYTQNFEWPCGDLDYFVEMNKANILRTGEDATVLCYSSMVGQCQKVCEDVAAEGVNVELIDLRTISPVDIDYATIGKSLKKTGMLVVVEQAPKGLSIGARIAEECQRRFFDYLDGPILTVTGLDVPNPVSKKLEQAVMPSEEKIKNVISRAARRKI